MVLPPEGDIMEYYAKSEKKILPQAEIDKTEKTLKNIMVCLEDELTETEQKIIRNNIVHLPENKKEKQKTLKEHQNDIVKCAEMFFLEYGKYFTEKEKELVVEACRIHDWGKANMIFSGIGKSCISEKIRHERWAKCADPSWIFKCSYDIKKRI